MKILGVHHVNIQVGDLATARVFYADVLGLREIERPKFPIDGVWFQVGGQQLHIGEEQGHRASERQHFAVHVDDLESAVAAIEVHGVAVRRSQGTLPGAGRQAFLRDPSGNLIELNQPE